jgi:hypothetical protein
MGKDIVETNIVKGFVDDVCDMVGLHRPDEFLPQPQALAHALGFPTVKEAFPSPKDVGDTVTQKKGLPRPPLPPTPEELLRRVG